jgi:hypothetical protein
VDGKDGGPAAPKPSEAGAAAVIFGRQALLALTKGRVGNCKRLDRKSGFSSTGDSHEDSRHPSENRTFPIDPMRVCATFGNVR